MTFFFVRHKREAVAEFSFCNGPFFEGYGEKSAPQLAAAQAQPGGSQTGGEKEKRFFYFKFS